MAHHQAKPAELPSYGPPSVGARGVAALGAVTGLGALAASSCCVLPIVLGGLGAGAGAFTILGLLAPLRAPLMVASTLTVLVGWFLYARRPLGAACGPGPSCPVPRRSPAALVLLGLATLLVAAAATSGHFEVTLIEILRPA